MSDRTQRDRVLPWAATVVWLATVVRAFTAGVAAVRHDSLLPGGASLCLLIAVAAVATAGVGAVIAGKTGNAVGWLLAAAGLELAFGIGAVVGVVAPCGVAAPTTAWLPVLGLTSWWAFMTTAVALFPSGSWGRGRAAAASIGGAVLAWAGMLTCTVGAAAASTGAIDALVPAERCGAGTPAPASLAIGGLLLGGGFAVVAASTIWRMVHSTGDGRRQLGPVAAISGALCVVLAAEIAIDPRARLLSGDAPWAATAWVVAGIGVPAAVAVSVIRSRTFGIYRLVSFRTDYRLWSVGLASAGVIAAVGLAWGVTALLGLDDEPVAVAIATLAAAGAIVPLWRRRQSAVDARFEQHQPDAATALASIDAGTLDGASEPTRGPVFDLIAPFAPIVVVEGVSGMRFAVPTDDREIGRHTFVHGSYDLDAMRRAIDLLELEGGVPLWGRTMLDVGANIGVSIVPLLRVFGAERGIAVEPAPHLQELLRLNVELNDLSGRVRVLPIGLSDRDGSLELALSPENEGDHRLLVSGPEGAGSSGPRTTVEVPVRRLDGLVDDGTVDAGHLGLIWLDVQGHEGHVLAGGRAVLASAIPVVTEFWPAALERTGGLDLFRDVARSCYRRVIDVRAAQASGSAQVLPTSRIDELAERYAGPDAFTDLLLLP